MTRRRTLLVAVVSLALSTACSGGDQPVATDPPDSSAPATSSVPPSTEESTTTTTTLPEDSLADSLEFIEVSVRIGVGTAAEVVSLAVDTPTLERIPATGPDEAPAWCTGSDAALADTESLVPQYLVRVSDPAVDATGGGAQRFELRGTDVDLAAGLPSTASFELVVDGLRYEVPRAEIVLGDLITSGTFRGVSSEGRLLEGAFLCG